MNSKKFNSNFRHNSRYNEEKIKKIVSQMMDESVNPQSLDFLFRYNSRNYPQTTHNELNLPGKFDDVKDTAVFIIDENAKQMDYVETIKPNGDMVKRKAASNVEQQTGILNNPKIEDIFDYCLYTTIQLKKPCYAIVATDYDYGKDYKDYVIEGFPFRIYFRIFNKQKVREMLNALKEKDYSEVGLSNAEYVRFIYCMIFAKKEFAKEVIEELVYLFATIENMNSSHQLDLHLALKMMIKFRFGDDINKKGELLEMITKSVHESKHTKISGYEVEQKSLDELKKDYEILKHENSVQKVELESVRHENSVQRDELESVRHENSVQREELETKNSRIKKLEAILAQNNIIV